MSKPIVDNGKEIDWGKTSGDYSKYRDIYPTEFYEKLHILGIGIAGQRILDLGTGTGVIPRALSSHRVKFVGTDISKEQINAAIEISKKKGLDIEWKVCSAEDTGMSNDSFDVITACQCWWYFDKLKTIPEIVRILKPKGKLALLYMNWLPYEDMIAAKTEELVLKYNPDWKGNGFIGNSYNMPEYLKNDFTLNTYHKFKVSVPFTRESWRGRIRACRGIGASLSQKEVEVFDNHHNRILKELASESFSILHEVWFEIYEVNKN